MTTQNLSTLEHQFGMGKVTCQGKSRWSSQPNNHGHLMLKCILIYILSTTGQSLWALGKVADAWHFPCSRPPCPSLLYYWQAVLSRLCELMLRPSPLAWLSSWFEIKYKIHKKIIHGLIMRSTIHVYIEKQE